MSSKGGTTDKGSYSGDGGANEKKHQERQKKLQTNINKLKAKGATKESIAGLTAKKTKEAKKFEARTTGVAEGRKSVQSSIDRSGTDMYGSVASKATDDYLVETGQVKVGNYFRKEGGNFIRISKEEGERLYAAGDPSISRSTIGNKESQYLKYGKSDSAMGSGDPTGIMTSTAISAPMWKRQQKIKAMTLASLSFAVPMGVGTLMRMSAADAWKNKGQAGYDQYLNKFYSNMAGETSSYGVKSKTTENEKEQEVSSANITDTRTGGKTRKSDETRFKSLVAVTTGSGSVAESQRTLMKRSGKTISSGTVST